MSKQQLQILYSKNKIVNSVKTKINSFFSYITDTIEIETAALFNKSSVRDNDLIYIELNNMYSVHDSNLMCTAGVDGVGLQDVQHQNHQPRNLYQYK